VRDHEQVENNQRRSTPTAGLRLANTGAAVAGDLASGTGSPWNPACRFQFRTDATTFHKFSGFYAKTGRTLILDRTIARDQNTKGVAGFSKKRYQAFERFYLLLQSAHENQFDFSLRIFGTR
jgi:hypothetical protein